MLKILNKENKKVICQMGNFCVVWEIPLEPQAIIQTKVFLCTAINCHQHSVFDQCVTQR